jgi:hypothetical protein
MTLTQDADMTEAKRDWIWIAVGMVVMALLIGAMTVVARSDEAPRYSIVATVYDGVTKKEYAKLRYNPAGDFATKEECLVWAGSGDQQFMATVPALMAKVAQTFGPDAEIRFECLAP